MLSLFSRIRHRESFFVLSSIINRVKCPEYQDQNGPSSLVAMPAVFPAWLVMPLERGITQADHARDAIARNKTVLLK
jgi:hypothetical protein